MRSWIRFFAGLRIMCGALSERSARFRPRRECRTVRVTPPDEPQFRLSPQWRKPRGRASPRQPVSYTHLQAQDVPDAEAVSKRTRPPKRFTEATLLTAMETAGKTLDEKELSDAMKETGLGTPATRASIIEVLLKREYIVRQGKNLEATDKGIQLIAVVHPEVKSPATTPRT